MKTYSIHRGWSELHYHILWIPNKSNHERREHMDSYMVGKMTIDRNDKNIILLLFFYDYFITYFTRIPTRI